MLIGCFAFLIATQAFLTEVPEMLRDKFLSTNEIHGVFDQIKRTPDGECFRMKGTYKIRPGQDFEWRTLEPFETLFRATKKSYCYSNEDECVVKPLKDLKGLPDVFSLKDSELPSCFFKAFDALYKEDGEVFHVLAKPKDSRLKKVLTRVEADGTVTNWVFRAVFPDKTTFQIHLRDERK